MQICMMDYGNLSAACITESGQRRLMPGMVTEIIILNGLPFSAIKPKETVSG